MNDPLLLELEDIRLLRVQDSSRFELQVPAFRVERGQFIAVTGESGCGKSTLLDLLALVLPPQDQGRFQFRLSDGRALNMMALWRVEAENQLAAVRRSNLGYVPQSGGLLPFLSVKDNLYLPPRLNFQADYQRRITRLARRLGIEGLLERKPESLSGGQRQRAAILLLADEPTAAVDAQRAQKIVTEFRALARSQNTAIIMVTHDHSLIQGRSDRHYVFDVDSRDENHVRSVCREAA